MDSIRPFELTSPALIDVANAQETPGLRCLALVDSWIKHKLIDLSAPKLPVMDRVGIAKLIRASVSDLKGVIDLRRWAYRGEVGAEARLVAVRNGKGPFGQLTEFLKSRNSVGSTRKALASNNLKRSTIKKDNQELPSVQQEDLRKRLMALLPEEPDKSKSNSDLRLCVNSTTEEFLEAKRSLLADGMISVTRGRGGCISRTKKSLSPVSPYRPSKQAEKNFAPENSDPPQPRSRLSIAAALKEDARLPIKDVLLTYSNNFMALISALKQREEPRANGNKDDATMKLLMFAAKQVESIGNRIINGPEEAKV